MPDEPPFKIKHIPMVSISLEALRKINERLDEIQTRIDNLEKKIEEKIPGKALTEDAFKQELQTTDEIVGRIISELSTAKFIQVGVKPEDVESRLDVPSSLETVGASLTTPEISLKSVETEKIDKIKFLLHKHTQLSSNQLSQLMNLSRTRCNEYFKQMERLGMVEPVVIGKEKFYRLG